MCKRKIKILLLIPTVLLIAGCSFKGTRTMKTYMSRQYTFIGATKYEEGFDKKEIYDTNPYLLAKPNDGKPQNFHINFKFDASFEIYIGYIDETLTFTKIGTYYERDNYIYMFNSDGTSYMTIQATLPTSINNNAGIVSIRIEYDLVIDKTTMQTEKVHLWSVTPDFDKPHEWK